MNKSLPFVLSISLMVSFVLPANSAKGVLGEPITGDSRDDQLGPHPGTVVEIDSTKKPSTLDKRGKTGAAASGSATATEAAKRQFELEKVSGQQAEAKVTPKSYPDGRGGQVYFPQGDLSFADEVVKFEKGDPCAAPEYSDPKNALGPPDYKYGTGDSSPCCLTLGCGGMVILGFRNNALVDVKGPDLYVFEVGEDEEPMELSISEDGRKWIDIGKISGATAAVDIAPYVMPGEIFHYVRLRDLKSHCDPPYPGADIDAVGVIGSALQLSIKNSVLFDYREAKIKPGARTELHRIAVILKEHPTAKLVIEGHTDSVGGDDYNQKLSEERAESVKNELVSTEHVENAKIETKGYGRTRPVASNESEEGREKNRRVEIVVMP